MNWSQGNITLDILLGLKPSYRLALIMVPLPLIQSMLKSRERLLGNWILIKIIYCYLPLKDSLIAGPHAYRPDASHSCTYHEYVILIYQEDTFQSKRLAMSVEGTKMKVVSGAMPNIYCCNRDIMEVKRGILPVFFFFNLRFINYLSGPIRIKGKKKSHWLYLSHPFSFSLWFTVDLHLLSFEPSHSTHTMSSDSEAANQ